MERVESLHQEIISRYTYNPDTPTEYKEGYWVYDATHNDLKMPVTLKTISHPTPDIAKYLKRLKDCKVDNAVKIYELYENAEGIFLATEKVIFSNLKSALQKCKKVDDFDAIFLYKMILTVHMELLRAGFDWFGT